MINQILSIINIKENFKNNENVIHDIISFIIQTDNNSENCKINLLFIMKFYFYLMLKFLEFDNCRWNKFLIKIYHKSIIIISLK